MRPCPIPRRRGGFPRHRPRPARRHLPRVSDRHRRCPGHPRHRRQL